MTIKSPGIIKTEEGMEKDIIWTLSEPFDTTITGAGFYVYKGYIDDGNYIVTYQAGSAAQCYPIVSDVSCITEGRRVGFNIRNIQANNASRYSIDIVMKPYGDAVRDENATLYIYS